jgi:hypothetical protein
MKAGERWRVRYGKSGMKEEAWRFFMTEKAARSFYSKVVCQPTLLWASIGHIVNETASCLQAILNSQLMDAKGFRDLWNRTPKNVRDKILKKQEKTLRMMIEDLFP